MSVGSWQPADANLLLVEVVNQLVAAGQAEPVQPQQALNDAEIARLKDIMLLDQAVWEAAVADRTDQDQVALVRFLTIAEVELPGWSAGEKSPVIPLMRMLKSRGSLAKDELLALNRWIKSHTDNRFLPYGSLMDRLR